MIKKCTYKQKKLCNNDECIPCFERSIANFNEYTIKGKLKIDCWNLELNKLKPRNVFRRTAIKYYFTCDSCLHIFDIALSNLTSNKSHWCPYCANQKLCSDDNCKICYNKSFASYAGITLNNKKKVDCFDAIKNNITPRQIFIKSEKWFFFNCDNCPHTFNSNIASIVTSKSWCIYCTTNVRNSRLCDDKKCEYCFKNLLQIILEKL